MATTPFRHRESVIRAILALERHGRPLNCQAVKGASRPLHNAAIRHFGSWRNALTTAGIDSAIVARKRNWNKAKIIARLRQLCRQGRSLQQRTVSQNDGGFARVVVLHFGSWSNALVAAGINPDTICRDPHWDRTRIVEAILLRAVQSEPLGSTTVRPHTLKSAAVRQFGSWCQALAAAGLEPADYVGRALVTARARRDSGWSRDRVRKAILQRHVLGLSLYGNAVLRDDRTLYFAGRTWFKSWSKALVYAGFDPRQVRAG